VKIEFHPNYLDPGFRP